MRSLVGSVSSRFRTEFERDFPSRDHASVFHSTVWSSGSAQVIHCIQRVDRVFTARILRLLHNGAKAPFTRYRRFREPHSLGIAFRHCVVLQFEFLAFVAPEIDDEIQPLSRSNDDPLDRNWCCCVDP